jgi:hypothetical protein
VGTLVPSSHALKLPPRIFDSLMQERRYKMNMTDENSLRKEQERE